jgi:hypothetical protein
MGLILTAAQAVALEKTEKEAHGEFEGECRAIAAPRILATSAL